MKSVYFLSLLISVFLLSACEALQLETSNNDTDDHPLTEAWWWLDAFEDEQGKKTGIGTEDVAVIFKNDSTFSGVAIWKNGMKGNEIFGVYQIEPAKICAGSTRKGIPEGSRSDEFVQLIRYVDTFQVTSNNLVLILQDGFGKLHLRRGESPPYEIDIDQIDLKKQPAFSDCI